MHVSLKPQRQKNGIITMMIFGTQSNERKKEKWMCSSVGVWVIVTVHYKSKNQRKESISHKNTDCVWFALIFQTKRKILARFVKQFCVKHQVSHSLFLYLAFGVARKQLQCDFSLRVFIENINQFFLTSSNCFYLLLLIFHRLPLSTMTTPKIQPTVVPTVCKQHTFGKNSYNSFEECGYHTFLLSTHTHMI